LIGAANDDVRFLSVENYIDDQLISSYQTGIDSRLPIADLIDQVEAAARADASASGADCKVFPIEPPFEEEQFEAVLHERAKSWNVRWIELKR
jgi:hypothetical protein